MDSIVYFIERLSTWVGKAFAWCILVLTFATTYEVFVRYVLREPTSWAFDMSYIMYGSLFMMAGAYTLARGGHVRGDVIFRLWPPRVQAAIELVLFILFFFPGIGALIYAGIDYAMESWSYMPFGPEGRRGEISINSPAGVPIAPLKTILPLAAFFLFLQGIAEVLRCIQCLRSGQWPPRLDDVEELEKQLVHQVERERAAAQGKTEQPA
ncbi:MAG: TRAP transporter small permease subunit [Candidatus Competibacteraceae bacterium]|nr:TRAP transporter small permease subunit [Candidatus Competibacteraceae bacterium]MCB1808596.1 TRAP transporter small permease subunit [Candidatus Competibacteraceae bacterium]MCB1814869.1 TRAP transporter small permease subunit [Candidatus Competibacteraceae bacterium]